MLKTTWALAALAMIAPLSAQRAKNETVAQGRKEFEKSCGFCHGPDATGARAPDLIRSAVVSHDQSGEQIGPVIRNGRPDKGMPPMPLSDAQIAQITAYLHARVTESLHSSHVPSDYPEEKLLTGDSNAGQAYFNGAGGCAACHSPTGDLAGVGRKYSPLNLQSRFLYPAGKRPTAVVTPASGQKVSGTVVHMDDFSVAVRDSGGWYHSWPRAAVKVEVHDPMAAHRKLLYQYTDRDMHNLFAYLETLK